MAPGRFDKARYCVQGKGGISRPFFFFKMADLQKKYCPANISPFFTKMRTVFRHISFLPSLLTVYTIYAIILSTETPYIAYRGECKQIAEPFIVMENAGFVGKNVFLRSLSSLCLQPPWDIKCAVRTLRSICSFPYCNTILKHGGRDSHENYQTQWFGSLI